MLYFNRSQSFNNVHLFIFHISYSNFSYIDSFLHYSIDSFVTLTVLYILVIRHLVYALFCHSEEFNVICLLYVFFFSSVLNLILLYLNDWFAVCRCGAAVAWGYKTHSTLVFWPVFTMQLSYISQPSEQCVPSSRTRYST